VRLVLAIAIILGTVPPPALAASDAETARRCLRAAYLLYPYKRPGAAPMTGGRLFYFKECMARHENAPADPAK
jgi:hypothetical protein